ncbi:uncharacterized protein I303_101761 [Kwoniella dejecticola CBS 10117]|uniref:Uncharacterized protein n=1 Tax=Kwoniella dejecticola CBS 10117 TaxID=1296121 RepID=A0A1A6ACV8_9TREE|nr:uncharacterized protein I303_02103 [Kwoniella dejecticola CBS 10117]OBR87889.1 hypothetical protein I303_02103 [Kwoniella dejecticola CBS 10117]
MSFPPDGPPYTAIPSQPTTSDLPSYGIIDIPHLIQYLSEKYPGIVEPLPDEPQDPVVISDEFLVKHWDLPAGYTQSNWADWSPDNNLPTFNNSDYPEPPLFPESRQTDMDELLSRMEEGDMDNAAEDSELDIQEVIHSPAPKKDVVSSAMIGSVPNSLVPSESAIDDPVAVTDGSPPSPSHDSQHMVISPEQTTEDQNRPTESILQISGESLPEHINGLVAEKSSADGITSYHTLLNDSAHDDVENSHENVKITPIELELDAEEKLPTVEISLTCNENGNDRETTPASIALGTPEPAQGEFEDIRFQDKGKVDKVLEENLAHSFRVIVVGSASSSDQNTSNYQLPTIFYPEHSAGKIATAQMLRGIRRSGSCPAIVTSDATERFGMLFESPTALITPDGRAQNATEILTAKSGNALADPIAALADISMSDDQDRCRDTAEHVHNGTCLSSLQCEPSANGLKAVEQPELSAVEKPLLTEAQRCPNRTTPDENDSGSVNQEQDQGCASTQSTPLLKAPSEQPVLADMSADPQMSKDDKEHVLQCVTLRQNGPCLGRPTDTEPFQVTDSGRPCTRSTRSHKSEQSNQSSLARMTRTRSLRSQSTAGVPQPPQRQSAIQANKSFAKNAAPTRIHKRSVSVLSSSADPLLINPLTACGTTFESVPDQERHQERPLKKGRYRRMGVRMWEADEDAVILAMSKKYENARITVVAMCEIILKNLDELKYETSRNVQTVDYRLRMLHTNNKLIARAEQVDLSEFAFLD